MAAAASLSIEGPLTIYTVGAWKTKLADLFAQPQAVATIDLSQVTECDTLGWQLLESVRITADAAGTRLKWEAVSSPIREAALRVDSRGWRENQS